MIADQEEPRAQGDLSKTPFAHVVLYLHREGMSGTLVVTHDGFETKVLFRNGRAVAARPLPRGTGLQDGLKELCALNEAPYAFWDGDLIADASGVVQGTLDPLIFVADSVRGHVRSAVVSAVIEPYRHRRLALTHDADPKRLGLRGVEARAVERLRVQPMTADEFFARSELVPEEAHKLLYLLLITRYVGPESGEGTSSSGVRAAVSTAPSSLAPPNSQPSGPRSSISSGSLPAAKVPSGSPARRASDPSMPAAAMSGRSSSPAQGGASSLPPQSRSSLPAWQQLASLRSDAQQRPSSPGFRAPTPSMAPPPVEALDDAGKVRRAEQLIERRNYQEAGNIADGLVGREAANPDYQALRALVLYHQFTGDKPTRPLIEAIESTLRLSPEHPRGLYLKGLVLKRMGKETEALRCFQKTLDADPKHVDAQRELRLAKMRRDR